jgi:hypothetical protein
MHPSRVAVITLALIPAIALAAPTSQVRALRQQVAALQLDHALNLSPQQAQALLPTLEGMKATLQAKRSAWEASEPARVAALTQAVADLKAGGAISGSTVEALEAARPAAAGGLRKDVKAFFAEARNVLTKDQLQSLRTVKLGVGQAEGGEARGATARGGAGHRHLKVMHSLLSDDFISLVQARAG